MKQLQLNFLDPAVHNSMTKGLSCGAARRKSQLPCQDMTDLLNTSSSNVKISSKIFSGSYPQGTRDRRNTGSGALCWSPQWPEPSAMQRLSFPGWLLNTSTEKVYTQSPTATVCSFLCLIEGDVVEGILEVNSHQLGTKVTVQGCLSMRALYSVTTS
eukprot:1116147-Amphidinium_carterae.3